MAGDDEQTRLLLKDVLERYGYRVIPAVNGAEAVTLLPEHGDEVRLALVDSIMPKVNGREAHGLMMQTKTDLLTIFTSGYAAEMMNDEPSDPGGAYPAKPIRPEGLLTAIRALLDQPSLQT